VSRSSTTISTLLFCGVKKEEAFKFSFISAIPIIFAAFLYEAYKECRHATVSSDMVVPYGVGFIVAFLVGMVSLRILALSVTRARLDIFGWYCLTAGCVFYFLGR
jgi:undecaprenyl-diphosphatase